MNNEKDLLRYCANIDSDDKFIPVLIPDVEKETKLSTFGYHLMVAGLYIRHVNRAEARDAQVVLHSTPLHRIVVDADSDDKCFVNELISNLKTLAPGFKFVATSRYSKKHNNVDGSILGDRECKKFHLISDLSTDMKTCEHIVNKLRETTLCIIDRPMNWTLPGGRGHYLLGSENLMTWEQFKRISIVDVWSDAGQFKTRLETIGAFDDGEYVANTSGTIGMKESENLEQVTTRWVIGERMNNFFTKFDDFKDCSLSFTDSRNCSIKVSTLYTYIKSKKRDFSKLIIGEDIKRAYGDLFEEDEGDDEFYECIFKSSLTKREGFNTNMNIDTTPHPVDHSNIANIINNINVKNEETKCARSSAIEFFKDNIAIERPAYLKTRAIFELECTKLNDLTMRDGKIIKDFKWMDVTMKFFSQIKEDYFKPFMVVLYFQYCDSHKIIPKVDNKLLARAYGTIQEMCHVVFPEVDLRVSASEEPLEINDEFVEMFKHVLEIMMNSGCVTSVVAMIAKTGIYSQKNLESTILSLSSLDVEEHTKRALYQYVSGPSEIHIASICKTMAECFYKNDIIYFLLNIYDCSFYNAYFALINSFPFLQATICEGAKKKKKKKDTAPIGMGDSMLKDCFNQYVAFLKVNECFYFAYENNAFRQIDIDKYDLFDSNLAEICKDEPSHNMYWHRRQPGIYNSISGLFDFHTPSMFQVINIKTYPPFAPHGLKIFKTNDLRLKSLFLSLILKAKHFIDYCNENTMLFILLCPVFGAMDLLKLNYASKNVQIIPFDLNKCKVPISIQDKSEQYPELASALKYLYSIVCTLSTRCKIDLQNPASFIEYTETHLTYQNNIQEEAVTLPSSKKTGEEALFIQLIKDSLRMKTHEEVLSTDDETVELDGLEVGSSDETPTYYTASRFFNGTCRSGEIIDLKDMKHDEFNFIFALLSWFIRFENVHMLSETRFFKMIDSNRECLYDQMKDLVMNGIGPMIINENSTNMTDCFKAFCENTIVDIDPYFKEIMPVGYTLLNEKFEDVEFLEDAYRGVMGIIVWAQYDVDSFVDLFKFISSFLHRGNIHRRMLAFLNRTGTGKNFMIEYLIDLLFKTEIRQCLTNSDIENSSVPTSGNPLCMVFNQNILVWIDELQKNYPILKTLVGTAKLSERLFMQQKTATMRVNAHVIVSANNDPKGADCASNMRMAAISRKLQYVQLKSNECIKRSNAVSNVTLSSINKYLGIQLMLDRLPSSGEMRLDDLGLFLAFWNCNDLVFHSFSTPISRKNSKTMNAKLRELLYSAQPALYLLYNNLVRFSSTTRMTLTHFNTKAAQLFTNLKATINSQSDIANSIKDLRDTISGYIEGDIVHAEL